jgi:hypothetical protein
MREVTAEWKKCGVTSEPETKITMKVYILNST